MLGKLLKYEFKATARILLPLYALLLAYSIFHKLISAVSGNSWKAPEVISFVLYIMILVGLFVMTLILIIQRFYKNLLTDEGYLMFTLPVKTRDHITSKLVVSSVWSAASGIVGIISILIIAFEDFFASNNLRSIEDAFKIYFDTLHGNGVLFIAEGLLAMLVALLSSVLMIYASVALGHLASKHKILASLGAYLGLSIVTQIAFTVISVIPSTAFGGYFATMHFSALEDILSIVPTIHFMLWYAILLTAIISAGFFALTNYILSRRLNLE